MVMVKLLMKGSFRASSFNLIPPWRMLSKKWFNKVIWSYVKSITWIWLLLCSRKLSMLHVPTSVSLFENTGPPQIQVLPANESNGELARKLGSHFNALINDFESCSYHIYIYIMYILYIIYIYVYIHTYIILCAYYYISFMPGFL